MLIYFYSKDIKGGEETRRNRKGSLGSWLTFSQQVFSDGASRAGPFVPRGPNKPNTYRIER